MGHLSYGKVCSLREEVEFLAFSLELRLDPYIVTDNHGCCLDLYVIRLTIVDDGIQII
jgi:hypothetical protein